MKYSDQLNEVAHSLKSNLEEFGKEWIKRERVTKVLKPHKIHKKLFLKHFGYKVIDYMIGVIEDKNEVGNCPIIIIMLKFFIDKNIKNHELYLICSELKNIVTIYYMENFSHFDKKVYFELADIIDFNFEGVLKEFDIISSQHTILEDTKIKETSKTSQANTELNEDRLSLIRNKKSEKIDAQTFFDSLDPQIIDKIENFAEHIDTIFYALYDIEKANSTISYEKTKVVVQNIEDLRIIIDSMVSFPVVVKTFDDLNTFLNSLTKESFEDKEKKELLVSVLIILIKDLESWIDTIFVKQDTDDIHYFDSSFANSIVELESLFLEQDFTSDDDDLDFF